MIAAKEVPSSELSVRFKKVEIISSYKGTAHLYDILVNFLRRVCLPPLPEILSIDLTQG